MKSIRNLRLFFTLTWKASPAFVLILLFNALCGGGQIIINVIVPKYLLDELAGGRDISRLLVFGGAVVLSNLLFAFLTNTTKRLLDERRVFIREKWYQILSEKIMAVEFSYLETPHYLDLKERAVFACVNQSSAEMLIIHLATTLKELFAVAGLLAIMFTLSWVLVALVLAIIVAILVLQASFMKYQVAFMQSIIPVNRKYGYYVGAAYDDKNQKDSRLYNLGPMFSEHIAMYNSEINHWFSSFRRKSGLVMGVYGLLNTLQVALANGYVGYRVLTGAASGVISIGSFTMYVAAVVGFSASVNSFGTGVVGIGQYLSYLEPFMEFMSLPDESVRGGVPFEGKVESVSFQNVTFCYPNSEVEVLKNVSFDIAKGEKISIVGLNGAGKTTLIKLLSRLYKPTHGIICVNGRNIEEYEHTSYMSAIAAVFQDHKLFNFTIEENISCNPTGSDEDKLSRVIDESGLGDTLAKLEKGSLSILGKSYDENGIDLSGGEKQKIAIARALYKDASLVILDEPTSALDPLAEAEIYENFNSLIGGKTAIYISHRMSSSVFCDRIVIIDGGEVADCDSHKNLMQKKNSLYYKLFMSQAENYRV